MKKLIAIILAAITVFPFAFACGGDGGGGDTPDEKEPAITTYADADYDGLYDDIDPAINDNEYSFSFKFNGKTVQGNEFTRVAVDYRDFLETDGGFNREVAAFACLLSQESYGSKVTIKNNEYKDGYSDISPVLVQVGGRKVEKVGLLSKNFKVDKNDRADITMANHTVLIGGKYKQVFFVSVKGYSDKSGWLSNFDIGANTGDYFAVTGAHSEWKNKAHHKGFDVTAERLLPYIRQYIQDNKKADAEISTFITGHSRGGAIASLIAKSLTDDGVKTLAYCFNTPNTVSVPAGAGLPDYDNIINIINEDDAVPQIPFSEWNNFKRYGQDFTFKISDNPEGWQTAFEREYDYFSADEIAGLKETMLSVLTDRESIYAFRENPDAVFENLDAEEKAQKLAEINLWFLEGTTERECIKTIVTENDGVYKIEYYTRPALILCAADAILRGDIYKIETFKKALLFYMTEFSDLINAWSNKYDALSDPHISETDIIGINMINI